MQKTYRLINIQNRQFLPETSLHHAFHHSTVARLPNHDEKLSNGSNGLDEPFRMLLLLLGPFHNLACNDKENTIENMHKNVR